MADTTPTKSINSNDQTRKQWIAGLLFGLLVLRGLAAFLVPLMDKTEAFYAEIARKMAETGDWITLQYDYGVAYWGKPPLSTWLSAIGIKVLGPNEIAPRILILLVSIGLVMMVWRFVQEYFGKEIAGKATLVFSSAAIFVSTAGAVMMDLVLLFSLCMVMMSFWRFVDTGNKRDGLMLFAGLGLGLLAKGLMVLAMASLPIAAWLTWTKQWKKVMGSLPWVSGLTVAAVIAAPWYAAAEIDSPGFLSHFFIGEHFKRYLDPTWKSPFGYNHSQPIGMIWVFYILGFAPWSLVIPAFVLTQGRSWIPDEWAVPESRRLIQFLLCWAFVPGLFLTFARNIIWTYSLPAVPPLAIMAACLISGGKNETEFADRGFRWVATTVTVSLGLALISGVYFLQNLDDFAKSTFKPVIAEYNAQCPDHFECHLWCFGKRVHSAEYYLQGDTKRIDFITPLFSEQREGRMDFIAGLDSVVNRLPDEKKEHITLVKKFKRIELWRLDYKGEGG